MTRISGYSWLLIFISALLTIVSIVTMNVMPDMVEAREIESLEQNALNVGQLVVERYGEGLLDSDRASIERAQELMLTLKDLWYYVAVDETGIPIASINLNGAIRAGYNTDGKAILDEGQALKTTLPTRLGERGGQLFIGLSKAEVFLRVREIRRLFLIIGLIMLMLAAGIIVTIWATSRVEARVTALRRTQKNLRRAKGTLEHEVEEHRQMEEALRESEQRYRYLLENAMESTFKDLEDLNKALEKRKGELEREVKEKTAAQKSLQEYSNRLEALNDLGQAMLDGESLEHTVERALKHLSEMVKFDRADVYEFDKWMGRGRLMGTVSDEQDAVEVRGTWPISSFRVSGANEGRVHLEDDLGSVEDPTRHEEWLIARGVSSFCRISLTVEDEVVGEINLGSNRKAVFNRENIRVAQDVADLLSMAIRQNRHEDERNRYEQELISSKDRAEEMARLKSAFLTNMSHEIRTPLSGIIGFGQVLHEEVDEELQEFTGLIQESAQRLLTTINSVLDLAKLEAGKTQLIRDPLDLGSAVRESVRLLQPLADEKGLELRSVQSKEPVICGVDEAFLEQIVNNLVGNSIKFTADGFVEVRVEVDGDTGYLRVQDSGVGISNEFIPKLFDEFRQEEMGADRRHEGSGLGLAITKRLVEGMGGQIEVISTKGEGSTFSVSFPLWSSERKTAGPEGIGSILVISPSALADHQDWSELGEVVEVNSATDLKDALRKARKRRYDLLIVDADGFDPEQEAIGLHAIRDIPDYANVAFIAVSTQSLSEFEEKYLRTEFDGLDVDPDGIGSFLTRFFDRLKPVQGGKFKDRKPRHSAGTGSTETRVPSAATD